MNGTLKKALRWIALPAMLVVLLTCSAFAVRVNLGDVTGEYDAESNTTAVTVKFMFADETDAENPVMEDAYLDWGTEAMRSEEFLKDPPYANGLYYEGNKIEAITGKAVGGGNYVELTLNINADNGVKIAGSKAYTFQSQKAVATDNSEVTDEATVAAIKATGQSVYENGGTSLTTWATTDGDNYYKNEESGTYYNSDLEVMTEEALAEVISGLYPVYEYQEEIYYVVTEETEQASVPYIYVRCASLGADETIDSITASDHGLIVRLDVTALPYNMDGGKPTIQYSAFSWNDEEEAVAENETVEIADAT